MKELDRFIKATAAEVGEEELPEYPTQWWLDTERPINEEPGFIAVETEMNKNPNEFVKVENMGILYTDQCEYYFVCQPCLSFHSHQQWSGSTKAIGNWRWKANMELQEHQEKKGWCEFCDPIFGNGGWS